MNGWHNNEFQIQSVVQNLVDTLKVIGFSASLIFEDENDTHEIEDKVRALTHTRNGEFKENLTELEIGERTFKVCNLVHESGHL